MNDPHRLDDGSLKEPFADQPWVRRRIAALIQINTGPHHAGRTIHGCTGTRVAASGFIIAIMAAQVPTNWEPIGNHAPMPLKKFPPLPDFCLQ
jgi:hypothetical protein